MKRLSSLDKEDEAFHKIAHARTIAALETRFVDDKALYVRAICLKIKELLVRERYLDKLVLWLSEYLNANTVITVESKQTVRRITNLILAEFEAAGYNFEDIKDIVTKIPDLAVAEGGKVVAAPDTFEGIKREDYSSEEDYHNAIELYLSSLSIDKILRRIPDFFYKEKYEVYVILRLTGLKGGIDGMIGDVNIYSPRIKKYFPDDSFSKLETVDEQYEYVNAAVPVFFLGPKTALNHAKEKLSGILDLISISFKSQLPVTIAANEYAFVRDGQFAGSGISISGNDPRYVSSNRMSQYLSSLDANNIEEQIGLLNERFSLPNLDYHSRRKLSNATHWYKKADEATKQEDVLLFSWLAIEGLLKVDDQVRVAMSQGKDDGSTIDTIKQVMEAVVSVYSFRTNWNNEYRRLLWATQNNDNYYDLPDSIIAAAGLDIKVGEHFKVKEFLDSLLIIRDSANDELLKDDLDVLSGYYSEVANYSLVCNLVREDILMIYRLRILLVHNAFTDKVSLRRYSKIAKWYAQLLILLFMDTLRKKPETTIEDIMLELVAENRAVQKDYGSFVAKLKERD